MFEETLKKLAAALDKTGIPYMIIGGQAVLIYGEPRFTRDIDITLGVGTEDLERVLSLGRKIGLKPMTKNIESFVSDTMVLPVQDSATGMKVDFVFSFTPYERKAIQRAKKMRMGRQTVCFASPEDVIIHKIFSGRPRDLEDARGIVLKPRRLDKKYIVHWLKEFDQSFAGRKFLETFKKMLKDSGNTIS